MTRTLIAGDLHGNWPALNRLISKGNPDIVLQCGDFGWWPQFEVNRPVLYGQQRAWKLKGVKPGNTKVYWCDGNHDNHHVLSPRIKPREPSELYKNVFYCPRGSRLKLPDGRVVLFIGGAESVDKDQRIYGHDWYPEEIISQTDLDQCLKGPKADIVISHTAPNLFLDQHDGIRQEKYNDPSTKALDMVLEFHKPDLWYFGHFHKEIKGHYMDHTKYHGLDYPGHNAGGRWWKGLD